MSHNFIMRLLNIFGCELSGTIARWRPGVAALRASCYEVVSIRSSSSIMKLLPTKSQRSFVSFLAKASRAATELTYNPRVYFFSLLCVIPTRECATSSVLCVKYLGRAVLTPQQQSITRRSLSAFQTNTNVSQDILVYSQNKDKYYKMLSGLGLFQMVFWGYFSLFAVQHLKASPGANIDTSDLPWWQYLLYKEGQYKNALSALCLVMGGIVLFVTMAYPRRAVRNLWLLKGGNDVQITTYTWFGQTHTFRKPLEQISFAQSRAGSGHYVPFRIKDKYFFYLVDKQGSFHNADLFDFVIGLKRKL